MAVFTVDSSQISASATRVSVLSNEIRSQVQTMLADLQALEGSWTGVAQASFQACIASWQATQAQVEASLDTIGSHMQIAAQSYEDAEAASAGLFAGV